MVGEPDGSRVLLAQLKQLDTALEGIIDWIPTIARAPFHTTNTCRYRILLKVLFQWMR
jgi:hypothetical protein